MKARNALTAPQAKNPNRDFLSKMDPAIHQVELALRISHLAALGSSQELDQADAELHAWAVAKTIEDAQEKLAEVRNMWQAAFDRGRA